MAGTNNPLTAAAAVPCKITVAGPDFGVNAVDLPVTIAVEGNPASCQFKIAQIAIFDATGAQVDSKKNINATTATLPPAAHLGPGTYDVFVNLLPAAGAPPGNPFNGGQALVIEDCAGKTLLSVANAALPVARFILTVN